MWGLPKRIMEHAEALPEATPLCPGTLLHLGNRAAVDQALSRLARSGKLMRICQGVYMRPIETRFGIRSPSVGKALAALSALWGETIVPCGGSAANRLGLTAQNPVRMVYLTIRAQPPASVRDAYRGVASCPALATGGAAPKGGRRDPRLGMARSRRSRAQPGGAVADARSGGTGRTLVRRGRSCRTGLRNR